MECHNFSCNCCAKTKDDPNKLLSANLYTSDDCKVENALRVIEKRFGDLSERRQYLIEKIYNIEKTMPLLMVYNASTLPSSSNELDNLIDVISPHLDDQSKPQEDVNEDVKEEINSLNHKVDQLYDEIIKTDIEIEESITRLESQRAINLELETKLSSMGHKTKSSEVETLNNLYCIISQEDNDNNNILNCLRKLKVFIEQEIRLKKCINVLEKREHCLNSQLDKLLFNSPDIPQHCTGKVCCQRQKKIYDNADESEQNEEEDDDDDLDISKYCDCCPLSKNKNIECWKD